MIVPVQKDQELLADISAAPSSPDTLNVWWLGQSGFLVKWNGHALIFDPYLSDSLTNKYADTDKPHVRMTERALDPRQLSGIEVVTSTHNHTDHLDAETLLSLKTANPDLKLVLPAANEDFARVRLGPHGPAFVPVDAGDSVEVGPFKFYGIHAAHNQIEIDEEGRSRFLGYVVTFGGFALYHSGDTLWHETLVRELRRWSIDIAFLPINGNKPERKVAGNLNGFEAAALAKAISADIVVPCHYQMFEFNTEEPDEFVECCERLGQQPVVMECGQRLTMGPPSEAIDGDL
jgi:L-ascorbate metabolism protein UlaG (beta-lactamase superfamily)